MNELSESMMAWRKTSWLPVLLIAATLLAYANSFTCAFVFDDGVHIAENPHIRQLWPLTEVVKGQWRPVVTITLAVNYGLGKLHVWGYHAFNVAIHIMAVLVLYGVIRRTLVRTCRDDDKARTAHWSAFATSLLWAVHPIQTESVTYIIQRSESLMGLFYLLTVYCVIRGVDSSAKGRWYVAAVVFCALGMGSKAVMVTAPIMVLLYDRAFLAHSLRRAKRSRWALYLGLASTWSVLFLVGVAQGVLRTTPNERAGVGYSFQGITPMDYLLTQGGVILHYLRLSVWPDELCIDYQWPVVGSLTAAVVPCCIVVLLLAAAVALSVRRSPWGFLGVWFFLILAPTSSIVPIKDPAFEHRMYLPLAAVISLVVLSVRETIRVVSNRYRTIQKPLGYVVTCGVLVTGVLLTWRTLDRNLDYRSNETMWIDVAAKRPGNARAHFNLGNIQARRGDRRDAIESYRKAINADPQHVRAMFNLANTLQSEGRLAEAERAYEATIIVSPWFAQARTNLGLLLMSQNKLEAAERQLRLAVETVDARKFPQTAARVLCLLGRVLTLRGHYPDAASAYSAAATLNPRSDVAHYGLGVARMRAGNVDGAVAAFRQCLQLNPGHTGAAKALRQLHPAE